MRLSSGLPRVRCPGPAEGGEQGRGRICGYLSKALSGRATELADDSAAQGQKRLTGLPYVSPFLPPSSSQSGRGGGERHEVSRSTSPADTHPGKTWICLVVPPLRAQGDTTARILLSLDLEKPCSESHSCCCCCFFSHFTTSLRFIQRQFLIDDTLLKLATAARLASVAPARLQGGKQPNPVSHSLRQLHSLIGSLAGRAAL